MEKKFISLATSTFCSVAAASLMSTTYLHYHFSLCSVGTVARVVGTTFTTMRLGTLCTLSLGCVLLWWSHCCHARPAFHSKCHVCDIIKTLFSSSSALTPRNQSNTFSVCAISRELPCFYYYSLTTIHHTCGTHRWVLC